MSEKNTIPADRRAELQARAKEPLRKFEEIRGFLGPREKPSRAGRGHRRVVRAGNLAGPEEESIPSAEKEKAGARCLRLRPVGGKEGGGGGPRRAGQGRRGCEQRARPRSIRPG